jgi:predicted transposase YbfD/YdcC
MEKLFDANIMDYRRQEHIKYPLYAIFLVSFLAIATGEDSFSGMEGWADAHSEDLKKYFGVEKIPSHDTIRLFYERIDPDQFCIFFVKLANLFKEKDDSGDITNKTDDESEHVDFISLDGKTIRNGGSNLLHMVSAWSSKNRLIIGHQKTEGKGNELAGLKEIIDSLDIDGHIVTIDALGCQKDITKRIVNRGGDYILQIKGNQKNLYESAKELFDSDLEKESYYCVDKKRGITKETIISTICDIESLDLQRDGWIDAKTISKIESIETKLGKNSVKTVRYYISSLKGNCELILEGVSSHWGIENNVHWMLDVMFNEDNACMRNTNVAENMNLARKMVLNCMYTAQKTEERETKKKKTLVYYKRRFSNVRNAKKMMEKFFTGEI